MRGSPRSQLASETWTCSTTLLVLALERPAGTAARASINRFSVNQPAHASRVVTRHTGTSVLARIFIAVAVIAVGTFCWLFFVPTGFLWPNEKFSSAAWTSSPAAERYKFSRDLVEGRQLLGKERDAVFAMLGQPDSASPDGGYVSYIVRNTETKGAIVPGIVVMDVRFSSGKVNEVVIRPI